MAISETSMYGSIKTELEADGFNLDSGVRDKAAWMDKFIRAVSKGIVNDIHANAKATGTDSGGYSHALGIE